MCLHNKWAVFLLQISSRWKKPRLSWKESNIIIAFNKEVTALFVGQIFMEPCHVPGIVPSSGDSGGSSSRGYRWALRRENSLEGWSHSGPVHQWGISLRRWCSRWDLSVDMRYHACRAEGRADMGPKVGKSFLSLMHRRNFADLGQGS